MDCNAAIETNREALKRVLAMLVAMAGLGGDSPATLPRHLHRAILRLLRPAEAAARRLIIVVARGLVVTLPPLRPRKPKPTSTILRNGVGTGIVMPRGFRPNAGTQDARTLPRSLALPLFDRLPRWGAPPRRPAANSIPRISFPCYVAPSPITPRLPPAPDDPLDATRLSLRLRALGAALDDLPGQAQRFARWRARAADAARKPDAAGAQKGNSRHTGRFRRVWPLRPGRPPGGRLSRYDPDAPRRKNIRDVDEILAHAHALARVALSPDTS
jgi:hypothetical protein